MPYIGGETMRTKPENILRPWRARSLADRNRLARALSAERFVQGIKTTAALSHPLAAWVPVGGRP